MKHLYSTMLFLSLLFGQAFAEDSSQQAIELLSKSEALMRSTATASEYQVDIVRPDWQRSMTFRSIDDQVNNRFRMEILSPRKTKGTVFLKIDNKLSMYLPKLKRQIAISPAMMHDAWMGSDFNHQDLLETDSLITGYSHQIIQREGEGDDAIITIESFPNDDSTVSWKSLIHRIRGDGLPLDITYICRDMLPARRLMFDQVREMDGRLIPTRWTMESLKDKGKQTIISLLSIDFDTIFNEDAFKPMQPSAKVETQASP